MSKIPLRVPKPGKKYKILQFPNLNLPDLITVKVKHLYKNSEQGVVVSFRALSITEEVTLQEWNERLAIEITQSEAMTCTLCDTKEDIK